MSVLEVLMRKTMSEVIQDVHWRINAWERDHEIRARQNKFILRAKINRRIFDMGIYKEKEVS